MNDRALAVAESGSAQAAPFKPSAISLKPSSFSLVPQTLREAMELSKLIADSDLAPKDYKGKPGNVLIAVQMGQEVGLSPMTAIQSIAVINGKPSLYGDVGKAILLSKGFIIEEDDVETIRKTGVGRCKITRPGHPPCERTFSLDAAKAAGLLGKQGPWTQYKERQMAWRAFWFAARDIAADVLKGLSGAEEAIDIPERNMGAAEVVTDAATQKKPEGPPAYADADFEIDLPKFTKLVASGKKSAADILTMVSSKVVPSEAQKAAILALKKDGGGAPVVTFEQVAEKLQGCTDASVLDAHADLIRSVADAKQRDDLTAIYHERKAEFEGGK